MPIDPDLIKYYKTNDEQNRFSRQQLEFSLVTQTLSQQLGSSAKRVLEIGAGPGFYSLWIANQGHQVLSIEPSPDLFKLLEQKAAQFQDGRLRAVLGDDTHITSIHENFDLILLMGPMYHLFKEAERIALLKESAQRLAPAGIILSTHLSRVGLVNKWFHSHPQIIINELSGVLEVVESGHDPSVPLLGQFRGHFDSLASIQKLYQVAEVKIAAIQSLDPLVGPNDDYYNNLPADQKEVWSQFLFHLSYWPDLLGTARTWLVAAS